MTVSENSLPRLDFPFKLDSWNPRVEVTCVLGTVLSGMLYRSAQDPQLIPEWNSHSTVGAMHRIGWRQALHLCSHRMMWKGQGQIKEVGGPEGLFIFEPKVLQPEYQRQMKVLVSPWMLEGARAETVHSLPNPSLPSKRSSTRLPREKKSLFLSCI